MDTDREKLAESLKALRTAVGLSQTDLSRRSGVGNHTLWRMEKGEIPKPGIDDMARLARFFGLDLNDMGAAAGVWDAPQAENALVAETDSFSPELAEAADGLTRLARRMDAEQQQDLAEMLEGILYIWGRRIQQEERPAEAGPLPVDESKLPAWLRGRVRPRG